MIIIATADDAIENVLFLLKHRFEQKAKDSFAHEIKIIIATADDAIENVLFLLKHRFEQKAKDSFAHEIKTLLSTLDEQSIIVEQAK